ncbi:hypothetical protein RHSIM_Rhsim04G0104900 [Rhododendron simsii]|uniref:Uncharacterized protein n=1 Tax=Rhododendron simsii TaxID=118357 RepID=A0A834HE80_RHOSS|nr:hypothetical protein RHSIM_Rhsim04G0104900 [Rhododendron simsii]
MWLVASGGNADLFLLISGGSRLSGLRLLWDPMTRGSCGSVSNGITVRVGGCGRGGGWWRRSRLKLNGSNVLDHISHEEVVDYNDPCGGVGDLTEERCHRVAKLYGSLKGRLQMRREFGGGIWVRRRGEERRGGEFVEVDTGILEVGLGIETELDLAEVDGGGGVVDGDVVGGGDEAGELEELVEMAMAWEWHYYDFDWSFFGVGADHAMASWILDISTNIHGGNI